MNAKERNEKAIQDFLRNPQRSGNFQYRAYNPMALKLLKPTQSINRLIGQSNVASRKFGTTMGAFSKLEKLSSPPNHGDYATTADSFMKAPTNLVQKYRRDKDASGVDATKPFSKTALSFATGKKKAKAQAVAGATTSNLYPTASAAFNLGTSALEKTVQLKNNLVH